MLNEIDAIHINKQRFIDPVDTNRNHRTKNKDFETLKLSDLMILEKGL